MTMTLQELLKLGGWAIWPLMIFSVITVALILERTLYMLLHNLEVKKHKLVISDMILNRKYTDAVNYCKSASKRLVSTKILLSGLNVRNLGEHRMEKSMETMAAEKISELENGLNFLVAIGSIAPITGFLGTVSGMITSFQSIANATDVNAQLVAGGIFEALITTAFGLIIAIVAITAYNVFAHIVDLFSKRIEEAGESIITNMLIGNYNTSEKGRDSDSII